MAFITVIQNLLYKILWIWNWWVFQSNWGNTLEFQISVLSLGLIVIYFLFFPKIINKSLFFFLFFILDSSNYAHYVFNAFDHDHSGSVNFEVSCLFFPN